MARSDDPVGGRSSVESARTERTYVASNPAEVAVDEQVDVVQAVAGMAMPAPTGRCPSSRRQTLLEFVAHQRRRRPLGKRVVHPLQAE